MNNNTRSRNSTNSANSINHITHDNPARGYSSRNSSFDNPFNMDFEYGYLSMMTNFSTFVSRTQDMYSRMEEGFSDLLESQRERRVQSYTRRIRNNRATLEASIYENGDNISNSPESRGSRESRNSHVSINEDDVERRGDEEDGEMGETGEMHNSSNNANMNSQEQRQGQTNRRALFDMESILYSVIPRTVIIDPNNIGTRGSLQNRGLSIQQVEENTEIINYHSIPRNEILNTECPISISPFTSNSVVLRLKRCRHCFVPFRMMAWLETHSTCPLCRISVVETATGADTGAGRVSGSENIAQPPNNNIDMTNLFNNIRDNLLNGFNNTTNVPASATTGNTATENLNNGATGATGANGANTNVYNLFNQLSNLSIDNINDDSIMFSFDMPGHSGTYNSHLNNLNELSASYIIPQLSQLFSNSMASGLSNRAQSSNNNNNNNNHNHENNNDDNSDNDPMDLD